MRRLPVYILIETSGGMRGEKIVAVNNGLQVLVSKLRQDPFALESVSISIITFDREPKQILPLIELESLQVPVIDITESSPPFTGRALLYLNEQLNTEIKKGTAEQKGDWRPLLFILTRGTPADKQNFREVIPKIKAQNFASIVACSVGSHLSETELKKLTDNVVHLDTADSSTLMSFFKWVSTSIGIGNKTLGTTEDIELPKPPQEVHLVI